jgi:hypothetical protein
MELIAVHWTGRQHKHSGTQFCITRRRQRSKREKGKRNEERTGETEEDSLWKEDVDKK